MEYIFPFVAWFPSFIRFYVNIIFYIISVVIVIFGTLYIVYLIKRVLELKTPVFVPHNNASSKSPRIGFQHAAPL